MTASSRALRFTASLAAIEQREGALERLATSFLAASGFDQGGEPFDDDDRGVLEPVAGLGWLDVNPDWRALAEEHCSPRQLDVLRAYADGLGPTEIGRRLGMEKQSAVKHLRRAEAKMRRCLTTCPTYRGNEYAGPYGEADHSVLAENLVLCGPRSPESDPVRVKHVPFFPANDRRDLYWTTLPRNPRDITFDPATARGAEAEWSDVVAMRPVPAFYPDLVIQDVDSRAVLLSTFNGRPIITFQADGESAGRHAARHKRRVEAWLALDENRPRLAKRHDPQPRSRILPNAC